MAISKDSTYVIMGILNTESIAYAAGRLIEQLGGKVIWTAQNELRRSSLMGM